MFDIVQILLGSFDIWMGHEHLAKSLAKNMLGLANGSRQTAYFYQK